MRHLEDTDPIPLVLAHLGQDERVQALLDGGHVSGEREGPWPCLMVEAGSDNVGAGRGGPVSATVSLVLYDSFEQSTGPWACRRILLAAIQSLVAMAESTTYDPADPIVVNVEPNGQVWKQNTTAGQVRYMTDVRFTVAPAETPSTP